MGELSSLSVRSSCLCLFGSRFPLRCPFRLVVLCLVTHFFHVFLHHWVFCGIHQHPLNTCFVALQFYCFWRSCPLPVFSVCLCTLCLFFLHILFTVVCVPSGQVSLMVAGTCFSISGRVFLVFCITSAHVEVDVRYRGVWHVLGLCSPGPSVPSHCIHSRWRVAHHETRTLCPAVAIWYGKCCLKLISTSLIPLDTL